MESIVSKISELKETLHHQPPISPDNLQNYLFTSQKRRSEVPLIPPKPENHNSQYKAILKEKDKEIETLQDQLNTLRQDSSEKEEQLQDKFTKALENIEVHYKSLIKYYEGQFKKLKETQQNNHDLEQLVNEVETMKSQIHKLDKENKKLHKQLQQKETELKESQTYYLKLEEELQNLQQKPDYPKLTFTEESRNHSQEEIAILKQKLKESEESNKAMHEYLSSIETQKSQEYQELIEEYDEKYTKAVKVAQNWKTRFDHLVLKFFTFLRTLKIDVFQVKQSILHWFEEAITETSSTVADCAKKYNSVLQDQEFMLQQTYKENQRLRKQKKSKH